jgi:hypothetical protein
MYVVVEAWDEVFGTRENAHERAQPRYHDAAIALEPCLPMIVLEKEAFFIHIVFSP